MNFEDLYKIFGNKLPEKHVFFATKGAPTAVIFEKTFGEWNSFVNDYLRFAAKQVGTAKSAKPEVASKEVADAKGKV